MQLGKPLPKETLLGFEEAYKTARATAYAAETSARETTEHLNRSRGTVAAWEEVFSMFGLKLCACCTFQFAFNGSVYCRDCKMEMDK